MLRLDGYINFVAASMARSRRAFKSETQHFIGCGHLGQVMNIATIIGLFAALCTTVAYIPQLRKCWETRSAGDLSLRTFSILTLGIALWVIYGFLRSDIVIILANAISFLLLVAILYFRITEK